MNRYNQFNTWLKNKFGGRTLKICIDGGFSCPNRDGTKSCGGCIFCGERGSGENTKRVDISQQVRNHLNSYKGERAGKFIAYFQNFSNTYDKVKNLKEKYDSALIDERIVALAVATRPDCIDEDIAKAVNLFFSDKVKNKLPVSLPNGGVIEFRIIDNSRKIKIKDNKIETTIKMKVSFVEAQGLDTPYILNCNSKEVLKARDILEKQLADALTNGFLLSKSCGIDFLGTKNLLYEKYGLKLDKDFQESLSFDVKFDIDVTENS